MLFSGVGRIVGSDSHPTWEHWCSIWFIQALQHMLRLGSSACRFKAHIKNCTPLGASNAYECTAIQARVWQCAKGWDTPRAGRSATLITDDEQIAPITAEVAPL